MQNVLRLNARIIVQFQPATISAIILAQNERFHLLFFFFSFRSVGDFNALYIAHFIRWRTSEIEMLREIKCRRWGNLLRIAKAWMRNLEQLATHTHTLTQSYNSILYSHWHLGDAINDTAMLGDATQNGRKEKKMCRAKNRNVFFAVECTAMDGKCLC